MADLPDLRGQVLGLKETQPDSSGFDPDQPWFVRFRVINKGKAAASGITVKLETFNGSNVSSGVFCWTSRKWTFALTPGSEVDADFHLPTDINHVEFGVEHAFMFTIDPENEIEQSGNPSDRFVFWSGKSVPVLSGLSRKPPTPPGPWALKALGVLAKKSALVVEVRNESGSETGPATLGLFLRIPKPGAPMGKPLLADSAEVPRLAAGAKVSIELAASTDFVSPERVRRRMQGRPPSRTAKLTPRFKPLIPFLIKVKEAELSLGFGPFPHRAGVIKFPGKT